MPLRRKISRVGLSWSAPTSSILGFSFHPLYILYSIDQVNYNRHGTLLMLACIFVHVYMHTVFLPSDATGYCCVFLLHVLVWLLFEGGIYFFGKSADVQRWLDKVHRYSDNYCTTITSKHSLSVLLLAVETSHISQTALALAWWPPSKINLHMCVCTAYSSRGYYSRVAFILLRAPDCVATIWKWQLFEEIRYVRSVGNEWHHCGHGSSRLFFFCIVSCCHAIATTPVNVDVPPLP